MIPIIYYKNIFKYWHAKAFVNICDLFKKCFIHLFDTEKERAKSGGGAGIGRGRSRLPVEQKAGCAAWSQTLGSKLNWRQMLHRLSLNLLSHPGVPIFAILSRKKYIWSSLPGKECEFLKEYWTVIILIFPLFKYSHSLAWPACYATDMPFHHRTQKSSLPHHRWASMLFSTFEWLISIVPNTSENMQI